MSYKPNLSKPPQHAGSMCPPSVQSILFDYLKPEQQDFVKPILRVLKKPAQMKLSYALLDYLESGEAFPPEDFTLGALFFYITRSGGGFHDDPTDKRILRPLHFRSRVPESVGRIINRILPSFMDKSSVPNL